ncbi:MAG: ral secretion pathway protein [Acidobacteriota bacterium]|jgi:general secretion pathway protein G|nr:ral secretion pathway protein [Acidobacteriota bacterium]
MKKQLSARKGQLAVEKGTRKAGPSLPTAHRSLSHSASGFSLLELVITLMILTILTMGAIPLLKVSVKRQREQRLREALHELRAAIDQFHREAVLGAAMLGQQQQQAQPNPNPNPNANPPMIDPRVRVAITDNTIFGTDNPDRYPPDLETLVNGVSVTPIGQPAGGGGGIVGLGNSNTTATSNTLTSTKKKVYLRDIPIDPMTGERDWDLRSTYDSKDSGSWGGENVFDVRSKSNGTALNGEKYSDW